MNRQPDDNDDRPSRGRPNNREGGRSGVEQLEKDMQLRKQEGEKV